MNRVAALAEVASMAMRNDILFQYTPGESLVLSTKLGNSDTIEWKGIRFDAAPFKSVDGGPPGWGYMVDERS
jgi:hypothetical protein